MRKKQGQPGHQQPCALSRQRPPLLFEPSPPLPCSRQQWPPAQMLLGRRLQVLQAPKLSGTSFMTRHLLNAKLLHRLFCWRPERLAVTLHHIAAG